MTPVIAYIIIYGLKLHWVLYVVASLLYLAGRLVRYRFIQIQQENYTEIMKKIQDLNINTTSPPEWLNEKEKRRWKKHIKDLH